MRIRTVIAASAAVSAVLAVGVAPAAQAYDRDAYAYGAAHMIQRSDIPKELGAFKPGLSFGANPGEGMQWICAKPQSDPAAKDIEVKIPGPKYSFYASYNGRGKQSPLLTVTVGQYATTEKAIKAFDTLKTRIKTCDGTDSSSYTDDDGSTYVSSTLATTGVVPSVTTAGVPSLFLSQNNLDETLPKGAIYISDSYTVYSLFDDTIIQTSFFSGGTKNLTTAQRKAINKVAFNAEGRWVD